MLFELISNSKASHIFSNSKMFLKHSMSSGPLAKGILYLLKATISNLDCNFLESL